MALDSSYCGVAGVSDNAGFYDFRHQLLWYCWCIRLMLGFMALDISYCGVTCVSD